MWFNINTEGGKLYTVNSAATTLPDFVTEVAAATFAYIDTEGKQAIGVDLIKKSVIVVAPESPNGPNPPPFEP